MARSRNIKPSFFQNELLGELQPIERLAFVGMWTIADYKGCIEFRPKRLKIQLLPYDECDFERIAINLDKSGFISMYSVAGQRYLKIINFEKHQNPHKNERETGSDIPDITDDEAYREIENYLEQDGTAPADSLLLIPDSPIPQKASRINALDSSFTEFWNAYPKKVGKDKAELAWKKKKPPIQSVLQALEWQKQFEGWTKEGGKYIPNPTTYINEGRWKDEPPEEVTF